MKHLLITILFLLLFTSPLFGQPNKTGVLYIWENGSSYKGEWKDGKKHGQGKFTYGKGKGKGDEYVGEWKDGKMHGQGTQTLKDEDAGVFAKFKGEWIYGIEWNGIFYNTDGSILVKYVNGELIEP